MVSSRRQAQAGRAMAIRKRPSGLVRRAGWIVTGGLSSGVGVTVCWYSGTLALQQVSQDRDQALGQGLRDACRGLRRDRHRDDHAEDDERTFQDGSLLSQWTGGARPPLSGFAPRPGRGDAYEAARAGALAAGSIREARNATPLRSPMAHGVATSPRTRTVVPCGRSDGSPGTLTPMISALPSASATSWTPYSGRPVSGSGLGRLVSKSRTGSGGAATMNVIDDVSIGSFKTASLLMDVSTWVGGDGARWVSLARSLRPLWSCQGAGRLAVPGAPPVLRDGSNCSASGDRVGTEHWDVSGRLVLPWKRPVRAERAMTADHARGHMSNERLRKAMANARVSVEDVADAAEVNPKTVQRWLSGRVPYARHRWAVAKLLQEDEAFLWPEAETAIAPGEQSTSEVVAAYGHRADLPAEQWRELMLSARRQIDLLGYALLYLPEANPRMTETLRKKATQDCTIRIALADPAGPEV